MILLLKPNDKKRQFQDLESLSAIEPPIWLATASRLYADSKIIDAEALNYSLQDTIECIKMESPEKVIIFPTGNHPSASIQQMQMARSLSKIFNHIEIKEKFWFDPTVISPNYELLDHSKYRCHNWHSWTGSGDQSYGTIYTSVSCPMKCKFCSVKDWYCTDYKLRDIPSVISDLMYYKMLGITNIKVMDELFVTKTKRFEELVDCISSLDIGMNIWGYARLDTINMKLLPKMKKAGINWLGIGIESGNKDIRVENGKPKISNDKIADTIKEIQDAGICVGGNFIFGFPEDTIGTMNETLELALDVKCEYTNFYTMMAYPGTQLYYEALEKGWYVPSNPIEYAQYSYECHPLRTNTLSSPVVLYFRDQAFHEYYNSVPYLKHMEQRFGVNILQEINNMTEVTLRRKLYEAI